MIARHTYIQGPSNERGAALALVVMFLAAITVLLGSLLSGIHASLAREHRAWQNQVAQTLARAGIERAAAHLAAEGAAYTGEDNATLADGLVSIRVTREDGGYHVESAAELRDGAHVLRRSVAAARVVIQSGRIVSIKHLTPRDSGGGAT